MMFCCGNPGNESSRNIHRSRKARPPTKATRRSSTPTQSSNVKPPRNETARSSPPAPKCCATVIGVPTTLKRMLGYKCEGGNQPCLVQGVPTGPNQRMPAA